MRCGLIAAWVMVPMIAAACGSSEESDDWGRTGGSGGSPDAGLIETGDGGGEKCGNGLDDDHNGKADDGCQCTSGSTQPCYIGAVEGSGKGACKLGSQPCEKTSGGETASWSWGACVGYGAPSAESCDGIDNDCDGEVDETCADAGEDGGEGGCVPKTCAQLGVTCGDVIEPCAGVAHCGDCPAGQVCGGGGPNLCGSGACSAKTCAMLGAGCGQVSDGCSAVLDCGDCPGGESCGGGGVPNQCGAADAGAGGAGGSGTGGAAGTGGAETGGAAGTGGAGTGGSAGAGGCTQGATKPCSTACGNGTQTCNQGVWGSCNAPQPSQEVCNAKDDDCDGLTDEGGVCPSDCAGKSVTWGACSGALSSAAHGSKSTVSNTAYDQMGSATWLCQDGNWVLQSSTCEKKLCSYDWGSSIATSGAFTKIYVTIANRAPEPPGLAYWNGQGYTAPQVYAFSTCNEPVTEFGGFANATTVVSKAYQTAFGRNGDGAGIAWWAGQFTNDTYALNSDKRGQFFVDFLAAAVGDDVTALDKRTEVAQYWVQQLVDHRCPWDEFGKTVMQGVNYQSNVAQVKASIDARISQMEAMALTGAYPGPSACN